MSTIDHVLECKSQGIEKKQMSLDALKDWIDQETKFWANMAVLDTNVIMSGTNLGNPQICQNYRSTLGDVRRKLENRDLSGLRDFLSKASSLKAVLAHGGIGNQIRQLVESGDQIVAQRLALIMSTGVVPVRDEVRRDLAGVTAILTYNPYMAATADIISAKAAMSRSHTVEQKMQVAQEKFEASISDAETAFSAYAAQKTKELDELHTQYENYLLLQGPSRHWKRVAESSWKYAVGAFSLFVALLLLPATIIAWHWNAVSSYIDHVVDISKGGLSLAAVAVFTIPVLAYGWVLKHISRVFTQNLLINADAEHRRVMAVTFLGLARRKSVAMGEQDRALILNALFRPSPSSPHDDGPPSGLLELFKK